MQYPNRRYRRRKPGGFIVQWQITPVLVMIGGMALLSPSFGRDPSLVQEVRNAPRSLLGVSMTLPRDPMAAVDALASTDVVEAQTLGIADEIAESTPADVVTDVVTVALPVDASDEPDSPAPAQIEPVLKEPPAAPRMVDWVQHQPKPTADQLVAEPEELADLPLLASAVPLTAAGIGDDEAGSGDGVLAGEITAPTVQSLESLPATPETAATPEAPAPATAPPPAPAQRPSSAAIYPPPAPVVAAPRAVGGNAASPLIQVVGSSAALQQPSGAQAASSIQTASGLQATASGVQTTSAVQAPTGVHGASAVQAASAAQAASTSGNGQSRR